MSMQSNIIPSGRARRRNPVAIAVGVAVALLAILALLGAHPVVLALVALLSLGSILILTDGSAKIESDSYTLPTTACSRAARRRRAPLVSPT